MRNCRKYGLLILASGVGILIARILPAGFYLIAAGALLVILGIIIIER